MFVAVCKYSSVDVFIQKCVTNSTWGDFCIYWFWLLKLFSPTSEQHCSNEDGTARSLLLVTASVDKMVLKKPIHIDADLTIVGAVTWVGRSSMEIQLELIQSTQGPIG